MDATHEQSITGGLTYWFPTFNFVKITSAISFEVLLSFPPGLNYCGYERCTPVEEFMGRNQNTWNLPLTWLVNFYMVKYFFRFEGERFATTLLVPAFVSCGNEIVISIGRYAITSLIGQGNF
jgi:hypothetical protein